jgi:Ferric reductase like transmembrane component
MTQWMYYLSRSTGIVALLLVVAALLWGFLFSSRATGKRLRPNWWLDLHNWLGGLALTFTGLHLVTVWLNSDSGIGLAQIFLPQTASIDAWAITWGVIATYVIAAAVFTTWPRRWKNRRWWRVVHVSTVVATGLVFLHAYQSGSDASQTWFQAMLVLAVGVATYGLGLRLSTLRRTD